MKKRKSIVCISLAFLLVLVVFLSGCTFKWGEKIYEYIDAEYEANENTLLEVNNVNGLVNITGWEGDTVSLKIIRLNNGTRIQKIYILQLQLEFRLDTILMINILMKK